jgi:hypothetical protein
MDQSTNGVKPIGGACTHFLTDYYRVPIAGGRFQVRELCTDCGCNVRGPGINVPFAEAVKRTGHAVEQLPVWGGARQQQQIGGAL